MLIQPWVVVVLCLVLNSSAIALALPAISNPEHKAAFDQILQANMELERNCECHFNLRLAYERDGTGRARNNDYL